MCGGFQGECCARREGGGTVSGEVGGSWGVGEESNLLKHRLFCYILQAFNFLLFSEIVLFF